MARTSEANMSDQGPVASGLRATYSGLVPSGSRARTSSRRASSQSPNAFPRLRA